MFKTFEEFLTEKSLMGFPIKERDILKELIETTQIKFRKVAKQYVSEYITVTDLINYFYKSGTHTEKQLIDWMEDGKEPDVQSPFSLKELQDMLPYKLKDVSDKLILRADRRIFADYASSEVYLELKASSFTFLATLSSMKINIDEDEALRVIDNNGVFIDADLYVEIPQNMLSKEYLLNKKFKERFVSTIEILLQQ